MTAIASLKILQRASCRAWPLPVGEGAVTVCDRFFVCGALALTQNIVYILSTEEGCLYR